MTRQASGPVQEPVRREPSAPPSTSCSAARYALLRTPSYPQSRAAATLASVSLSDGFRAEDAEEYLRGLCADPVLREAIALASPALDDSLRRLETGAGLTDRQLRRTVRSVTSYLIRMSSRPTPFGLMAGVSVAEGGAARAKVRQGDAHRRVVRVDRAWLHGYLRQFLAHPAVVSRLTVRVNNLCFERAGRVVLPWVEESGADAGSPELSVRCTPPVQVVLAAAGRPVAFAHVVEQLREAFPAAPTEKFEAMLRELMDKELLLTDLFPPLGEPDALGCARRLLVRCGLTDRAAELDRVQALIEEYAARALGSGAGDQARVVSAMRALHESEHYLHVDLLQDTEVQLPTEVWDEVAAAASVLWRLSAAEIPWHFEEYRNDFTEAYGFGRPVPLTELLDPERGLGAPAGYRLPKEASRPGSPAPHRDDHGADLLALVQEAMLLGQQEIELTDELVDRLADGPQQELRVSLDLGVSLLASSVEEIDSGRFRLVLPPIFAGDRAGSVHGRFAYLSPDLTRQLDEVKRHTADGADGTVCAQLVFTPRAGRAINVAQVPQLSGPSVTVGVLGPEHADDIPLDDLAVVADQNGLHLFSLSRRQRVVVQPFNMLNARTLAPNIARFMIELSTFSQTQWSPWHWGIARALPFLPRVRYRRTVLALARWRVPHALAVSDAPSAQWQAEFAAWRRSWAVPDLVQVSHDDHRIPLDLRCELHLDLLRRELRRRPQSALFEVVTADPDTDYGWLDGHAHELTLSLLPHGREAAPRAATPTTATATAPLRVRTADLRHQPGGAWIYAKIYATPERQDEILTQQLPVLLARCAPLLDRWFYLRYRDPQHHLRLRLRAAAQADTGPLLDELHTWFRDLRGAGLAGRLTLDGYDPEVERYGGPDLMPYAERAFQADSEASIRLLRVLPVARREAGPELLAAASTLDLLASLGAEDWQHWLLRTHEKTGHHEAFRSRRAQALGLVDPDGRWDGLSAAPWGQEALTAFHLRRSALHTYQQQLARHLDAGTSWSTRTTVHSALLHMHHNRLLGTDRALEARALAVVRGVVEAHLGRTKAGSR
ncbi:lantibiotic dehydratase [Kitasatospora sp. NPDC058965]|uniref:lantibiotic dehydratase n=1 Tax=Kitasatospora sp. NPDC058965 TaxID=3346682 RepID=UPI003687DF29